MKKYRRVMFHDTEEYPKFEENRLLFPKMTWGIWWILMWWESLYFDVLLFSIAYEVSAKKVQKNDLSWQWKKIQAFKKNWLFVWKMTWEIWRTVTRVAESRKICTLMGYFSRRYVMFELKKHRGTVWKMTYIWFQKWHE